MFVPSRYDARDAQWHRRIVAGHPLATFVTNGEPVPWATRLPALVAPGEPEAGPLPGVELVGHLNRANPHWRSLTDGTAARLMFDGPGGFVTPAVYHADPAAPTWNFASVHVCGRIRLVHDPEQTLAIVRWTAERLEERFGAGWDCTSSLGYFRAILPAVGAFRLTVESVEAMFKLSQEKDAATRDSVIARYEADPASGPLARLMREYGTQTTSTRGRCPS
ncbi:FMN-binding negative transcriptional regulator [Actinoplanes sp. NPDC049316]|uniref:FMN-binding negative transcriptional regulator n=1 Tax=Actinoplanes sp. NPDC049316 TaxID=3154727 RepID=UPI00342665D4